MISIDELIKELFDKINRILSLYFLKTEGKAEIVVEEKRPPETEYKLYVEEKPKVEEAKPLGPPTPAVMPEEKPLPPAYAEKVEAKCTVEEYPFKADPFPAGVIDYYRNQCKNEYRFDPYYQIMPEKITPEIFELFKCGCPENYVFVRWYNYPHEPKIVCCRKVIS